MPSPSTPSQPPRCFAVASTSVGPFVVSWYQPLLLQDRVVRTAKASSAIRPGPAAALARLFGSSRDVGWPSRWWTHSRELVPARSRRQGEGSKSDLITARCFQQRMEKGSQAKAWILPTRHGRLDLTLAGLGAWWWLAPVRWEPGSNPDPGNITFYAPRRVLAISILSTFPIPSFSGYAFSATREATKYGRLHSIKRITSAGG